MDHGSGHTHGIVGARLRTAFLLTLLILAVEVGGGLRSNSLALLADAGHVLTDIVALGLAWYAARQAERPADVRNTYGYHRIGILVALVNAGALIAIVGFIAVEAIRRLQHPAVVTPTLMFAAAAVGIAVNLFIGFSLRAAGESNLNVRAAVLHVFGDVGASATVIVAGLIILTSHWYPIDALLSLVIAVLIARGVWGVLTEAVDILMEATPTDVNVAELVRDLMRVPEVEDVHDLHVWALADGMRLFTAHLQVRDDCSLSRCAEVLTQVDCLLEERYGIAHSTIQLECARCAESPLHCTLAPSGAHDHPGHVPDQGAPAPHHPSPQGRSQEKTDASG
jgi:cobalt-zinc-cadmium efflux system protein